MQRYGMGAQAGAAAAAAVAAAATGAGAGAATAAGLAEGSSARKREESAGPGASRAVAAFPLPVGFRAFACAPCDFVDCVAELLERPAWGCEKRDAPEEGQPQGKRAGPAQK